MRPKKIILLVDGNEISRSTVALTLFVNGYKVLQAVDAVEAAMLFAEGPVNLVIARMAMKSISGNALVSQFKQIAPYIPAVLFGNVKAGLIHDADALVDEKNCSAMELLELIKLKTARKRGPRKGFLNHRDRQPVVRVADAQG